MKASDRIAALEKSLRDTDDEVGFLKLRVNQLSADLDTLVDAFSKYLTTIADPDGDSE